MTVQGQCVWPMVRFGMFLRSVTGVATVLVVLVVVARKPFYRPDYIIPDLKIKWNFTARKKERHYWIIQLIKIIPKNARRSDSIY